MDQESTYWQTLFVRNSCSNTFLVYYRIISAMLMSVFFLMILACFPPYYLVKYASHWSMIITTGSCVINAVASLEITRPHKKRYHWFEIGHFVYQLSISFNTVNTILFWVFLKNQLIDEHEPVYQKVLLLCMHTIPAWYCYLEIVLSRVAINEEDFIASFGVIVGYLVINCISTFNENKEVYEILQWSSIQDVFKVVGILVMFTILFYGFWRSTKGRVQYALVKPGIKLL